MPLTLGWDGSENSMPIEPQEDPPIKPGQPSEPPRESPPGSPRPEVPPPMRDPGELPRPEELPGRTPDEMPVRGPEGPHTPDPTGTKAGDASRSEPDINPGISDTLRGQCESRFEMTS
jgi:hypothetical protein